METNRCIKCGQILEEGIFCAYCGHDRRKGITLREYIGGRGSKLTPEETFRILSPDAISHYDNAYVVANDYNIPGLIQGEMIAEYLLNYYDQLDINVDGVISYVMLKGQEGNLVADSRTEKCVFQMNLVM